jgi:hypothetical protein
LEKVGAGVMNEILICNDNKEYENVVETLIDMNESIKKKINDSYVKSIITYKKLLND